MTDLVTLIKTAIENVPQRDRTGRIDTQSMAEAAAKAIEKDGWRSPDYVENILLDVQYHYERKEA